MGALFAVYTWLLYRILKSLQLDELFSFTQVVLPTFILERRSLLEMYADFFAHPDLFVRYLTLELEHSLLLMLLMALVGCPKLVVLKNIAWILVETSKNSQISQTCSCKTPKHPLNFPVSKVPAYISLCLSFFLSLCSISDQKDPKERMVQVVKWYLSAFHAGRKGSVAKKPYNPILGEIFRCHWVLPGTEDDMVSFLWWFFGAHHAEMQPNIL